MRGPPPGPGPGGGDRGEPGRRATWRWWEGLAASAVALFLAGAAAFPVVRWVSPSGDAQVLASVLADLVALGLLVLWLRRFHPAWRGAMGLPGRPGREVAVGLASGLVLYPIVALVVAPILVLVLRAATGEVPVVPRQVPAHLTPLGVGAAVVFALVAAPIQEEFVFRGLLFRALRDRHGFPLAAWGSAAAFGLVHYVPAGSRADSILLMGAMVATGYGLALVYERRGNLVAPVAAHAAFNVVGLVLVLGRVSVG